MKAFMKSLIVTLYVSFFFLTILLVYKGYELFHN